MRGRRAAVLWALVAASEALAMGGGLRISISGVVSDFDARYVYLDARAERYRINRSAVPEDVQLRPGHLVDFEVSLSDMRVLPATVPPVHPYKEPRKRTPAEQ